MCASQQPLNQHVLISRRGKCFWDYWSMHVQRSVKSVRRAKHMYYIERVSRMCVQFWTAQNVRIWSLLKKTTCFICFARRCCSLSYSSFSKRTSWRCSCICALCLLFRFRARLLALPRSHHNFCHFCRRNNETTSATTALRTINLPKCTQFFVNKVFKLHS